MTSPAFLMFASLANLVKTTPNSNQSMAQPRRQNRKQSASPAVKEPPVTSAAAQTPESTGQLPDAISPRAKNLAKRQMADLRQAVGTGPSGRVIERDVLKLVAEGKLATAAAGEYPVGTEGTGIGGRVRAGDAVAAPMTAADQQSTADDAFEARIEKHSNIRKVIARQMHHSISSMAQLTHTVSFDASAIMGLRSQLKQAAEKDLLEKVPTIGDMILYAVSRVLARHEACNAHYDDEQMTYFKHVNLGVAVDTPRGLMVPTIFKADNLSLGEISTQVRSLAGMCREGTISPDLLQGGTFTVSNLGAFGIESFTPVINPPQTCILGVCTITDRVRERDGNLETWPAMTLSLTYDHRALDGAPASRFLQDLCKALENYPALLVEGRAL